MDPGTPGHEQRLARALIERGKVNFKQMMDRCPERLLYISNLFSSVAEFPSGPSGFYASSASTSRQSLNTAACSDLFASLQLTPPHISRCGDLKISVSSSTVQLPSAPCLVDKTNAICCEDRSSFATQNLAIHPPPRAYSLRSHNLDTMGQSSKFSFPIPGRKNAAKEKSKAPPRSAAPTPTGLSKAQRILGTESELNIDFPTRDDAMSWRYPSSRSSMSISISDSTLSTELTNDTGSFQWSGSGQMENESGAAVSKPPRLHGKASSTLLGQRYGEGTQKGGEDAETETSSTRRMRHEDSSSTLKSYYDRQKSPLSISQQTSDSSARDLALRKGLPPISQESPGSSLLQVESADFEQNFVDSIQGGKCTVGESPTRKKPLRLDLTMLLPLLSRRASTIPDGNLNATPPSTATNDRYNSETKSPSTSGPRLLTKAQSRDSFQQQHPTLRQTRSYERLHEQTTDTISHLYDSYEEFVGFPHMSQIPESTLPERGVLLADDNGLAHAQSTSNPVFRNLSRPEIPPRRFKLRDDQYFQQQDFSARRKIDFESHVKQPSDGYQDPTSLAEKEPISWTHVRRNMVSPPCDSSACSVSSRNTKTSRHTSASVFSNSDLKQNSVLSLSSDSGDELEEQKPLSSPEASSQDKASRVLKSAQETFATRPQASWQTEPSRKLSTRKGAAQVSPFSTIPEASAVSARLSGPWSAPKPEGQQLASRLPQKRGKRPKRALSNSSKRASVQLTPPLTPDLSAPQKIPDSSRFMALTEQEAALVAALRNKKQKMREKIIQEHETSKSPAPSPETRPTRQSTQPILSSAQESNGREEKHKILLCLEAPLPEGHTINTAEPSPDLSDFMSFQSSGDESTPRTSYVQPKRGKPRPDSVVVSPTERDQVNSEASNTRLSAVGASSGFRKERLSHGQLSKSRNKEAKSDESDTERRKDFLLDENEEKEGGWGMGSNREGLENLF